MKNFFEKVDKIKEHPNGKAFFFFGFYLFFFLFVFMWIHSYGNKNALTQEYEKGKQSLWTDKGLASENFYYDYKITLDGELHDYYGKMLQKEENFKYNNLDYYKKENDYFVDQGTWVKTENPYTFRDLVEPKNLLSMIEASSYVSKDELNHKENEYQLLISSNTIHRILYGEETDYDDVPNTIFVRMNQENQITFLRLQLDSFCHLRNLCNDSLELSLSYELFGEVRDLKRIES